MTKKTMLALTIMLTLLFVSTQNAAASDLKINKGLWNITTTMEIPGLPIAMPPTTMQECINDTANMLEQFKNPQQNDQDDCSIKNQHISGNTVTYDVVCNTPQGKSVNHASFTYTGDNMHGTMKVNTHGQTMTIKYSGHRVGPCNR